MPSALSPSFAAPAWNIRAPSASPLAEACPRAPRQRARPVFMSAGATLRNAAPDLSDPRLYKGAAGRIAVVGGSREYTGAPYYAAMAALRGGGELATVYCHADAAPAIKAYSPDLVVHPGFSDFATPETARAALGRAHAVVLGPGLGRDQDAAAVAAVVIRAATTGDFPPLVIDADGLFFLARKPALLDALRAPQGGAPRVMLTPNAAELRRLCEAMDAADATAAGDAGSSASVAPDDMHALATWFDGGANERDHQGPAGAAHGFVALVLKGAVDRVVASQGGQVVVERVDRDGSRKRCGGQGDVLAGLVALYAGWVGRSPAGARNADRSFPVPIYVHAAAAACATTREAGRLAFARMGRSMVASDMLDYCGQAFEIVYETLS